MGWIWDDETVRRLKTPKPPRGTKNPDGSRIGCLTSLILVVIIVGATFTTLGSFHIV